MRCRNVISRLGALLKKLGPNVKRGGHKTGTILCWGTSNADPRGIESFKRVLESPKNYGFMQFQNVWAECKNNKEKLRKLPLYPFEHMLHHSVRDDKAVGWFIPYYDSFIKDREGF